ncbi:MAG: HlyD family secretion protein [Alphaproteobacteria bacterium]|jgi:HlyD family secretion protein|nr:HlyD family secretion protein [Alphaproteobacteria bacterium]
MSMSKRNAAIGIILCLALIAAGILASAPSREGTPAGTTVAFAQQADKRWLAVAPGRVEPPSGIIKVAAPTIGIVAKVLVKANDTVFAGEPLVLLNDDEAMARYAVAETQVGMRRRLRDDQKVTGRALERRRGDDAVAEAEADVFDAQVAVDKAAAQWRTTGAPVANLTNARSALARAQDELAKRQAELRAIDSPLPTANEAQMSSARGDLALARVNLEKLKIRAPIDGTVLQININPGELAAPSGLQPLLSIANLSTLNVRAELDERDISEIKVGQAASVRATAFPGKEFAGTVMSIAPLVEPSRLGSRGLGNRADVDAVEVVVKLTQPGPLTTGMKVDVYFGQEKAAAKN